MVHAFITSRIDNCNSVLRGASAVHLRPLQNVLNSAARIILRKQRLDRITAEMCELPTRGVHGNGEDWDPMGPMGFPWEWE